MEGFKTWLNQKIANFLGDFEEERQPQNDPSPTRALCRILLVVVLIVGFGLLLDYHFTRSPTIWVKQIDLPKNQGFVNCSLYHRNEEQNPCKMSPSTTTERNPLVCPCRNVSLAWRDFVSVYTLRENSSEWSVTQSPDPATPSPDPATPSPDPATPSPDPATPSPDPATPTPSIDVPILTEANDFLLKDHVVKNEKILTSEMFCKLGWFWPVLSGSAIDLDLESGNYKPICLHMASTLLPGSIQSQNRSTELFESPNLVNRELFSNLVAQRAQESVLRGRLDLDMINFGEKTLSKIYNLYAELLTGVLDRIEMEEWKTYYEGAVDLSYNLKFMNSFGNGSNVAEPLVVYLKDDDGQFLFLRTEVAWAEYYGACDPMYCEETKQMKDFQQLYRALGIVGGVSTLVLGLVKLLLWPCFASVLGRYCNRPTASVPGP